MKAKVINKLRTNTLDNELCENGYDLSDIWKGCKRWSQNWVNACHQVLEDFPNLMKDEETAMSILGSTFVNRVLLNSVSINFGNLNIAFHESDKFWGQLGLIMYDMASKLIGIWSILQSLKPDELLNMALQVTNSKDLMRSNDSQEQRTGFDFSDFANAMQNDFINGENSSMQQVTYGNQLAVFRRLIKTGVGIDLDFWTNKFETLVVVNYEVKLESNEHIVSDFRYNGGEENE